MLNRDVAEILAESRMKIENILFDLYALDTPEGDNKDEIREICDVLKQLNNMMDE